MRTRHRALTALATASLVALPLAACTSSNGENEPTTATTTQEAPPAADPSDASPQERVEAYLEASDAAATEGWKDTTYADDYLVPELAEKQKADDEERAATGAVITGDRQLSEWTVVEETDTTATVEFCEDGSGMKATKEGEPYDISNELGEYVGQYKLTREAESEPWMIKQKGYYEEGTTCAEHFAS